MSKTASRTSRPAASASVSPAVVRWLVLAAGAGLVFATASTWVHYRILHDPLYSSFCDVSATFSCTQAYTSRFGSIAGVPVALLGTLYFGFVLVLIALCQRSVTARQNLAGYVFAVSTVGLAGVLYLAYASFAVLQAVCLLCVGVYVAVVTLFLVSGRAAAHPLSSLPARASRDLRTLVNTPAALGAALAFAAVAVLAVALFPGGTPAAASTASNAAAAADGAAPPPDETLTPDTLRQIDEFLAAQPRVTVPGAGGSGAAVVLVKFNDYQCPACAYTHEEYAPVLERLQREHPGRIAMVVKDFPLDPECNPSGGGHAAACEAAVAVRLARERGRGDEMEAWLYRNQASLTPERVRQGLSEVAGVPISEYEARYARTLDLVRADVNQGIQLDVRGTPTVFMNGIRLPNVRGNVFQAFVEWELRRVAAP